MAENLYESSRLARTAQQTEIRAERYTGRNKYMVHYGSRLPVTVYATGMAEAIWTAGKHWGIDPRKSEFHQECRVRACR